MCQHRLTPAGLALIAGCAVPALAEGPALSNILYLPGDSTLGPAAGDQTAPAIARGGDMMLAVWVDASTGAGAVSGIQGDLDVVAARLDATGQLIDQTPFVISRDAGYQRDPRVAWNGASWLVIWENQSPTEFFYQTEILAARVSPDGAVLDDAPIRPFGSDGSDEAVVTSNGSDWLVVTQNFAAGQGGIRARRIAADGSLPDAAPAMLVEPTYYLYFDIDIDSAGGEHLLTYQGNSTWTGLRFTADLAPVGAPLALPPLRRIQSNGSSYYVVYNSGNLILGSPMSVDGQLLVPGGVQLGNGSVSAWFETDVGFDGTLWWVSHKDAWEGLTFQRVTSAGDLLDPDGISIDPANDDTNFAHRVTGRPAGGATAVWQDLRVGGVRPYDIYAASVVDPSMYETGSPISLAAPMQTQADIAEGQDQYLIVFTSALSGGQRVLAVRCDGLGNALDAEPIVVGEGPDDASPAAAFNGQLYMIVWNDGGTVVSRRMDAQGALVDAAPLPVMTGGAPDVAALAGDFLVAVTDIFNFPHFRATYVRRMSGATGQPIDPDRFVVSYGNFAQFARATTFDGRWLVTWQDNFSHDNPQAAIYARFIDADATVSPQITALYSSGGVPDVAASGDVATFVWRNNSLANANNYIAGRRMSPDGTFIDASPFVVSEMPGRQLNPVVAWNGAQFTASWEDQRNQVAFFDARTEIFGARLATSGGPVVDAGGYGVFESDAPVISPALASLGGERSLAAASPFRDEPGLATYRVGLRLLGAPDPGDVDGDGNVGILDFLALLGSWGPCPPPCPPSCPADFDDDCQVGITDLLILLGNWG